jgi:hypothetical protein
LPIDLIWGALADYFRRPATRTAAWRALRPRVEVFLKRLPERGADVIRATASLCDKPVREEVAAAFAPHLARIVDGRAQLDRALASIDRCIARRTRVGDLGAALAAAR